jgi:PTS system nitrogen regulatory IIA component
MQISTLLNTDTVASGAQIASKKRLLEFVSDMLAKNAGGVQPRRIFESLVSRERLGSTGLGGGVAIPHGRVKDGHTTIGAFVQLEKPIDYDAVDRQPVDLVFALLVPMESTQEHLEILSRLAELFSSGEYCDTLRAASDSGELLRLLGADHAGGNES